LERISWTMNASDTPKLVHGGDLSEAIIRFGMPEAGWLDLSTGINPVAYPNTTIDPSNLWNLPQQAVLDRLLGAARSFYGLTADAGFVAAPGTQAILQCLPGLRGSSDVAIIAPTYEEHAETWRAGGHRVRMVDRLADAESADVVVVVNPNNPDGQSYSPNVLISLAENLATKGGLLVVDQAFTDPTPELSLASKADIPGLILLHSFGKFFGLAGLRLGFASGAQETISLLKQKLGPWAVSGPALEIGARAYADEVWAMETRTRLTQDRARLDQILSKSGFEIVGGTDLFRLGAHEKAGEIYHLLGEAGILVRPFPDYPKWLRFGLPGNEVAFSRLATALGDLSGE
jgi:cobalamin biosynthesis protein CobC